LIFIIVINLHKQQVDSPSDQAGNFSYQFFSRLLAFHQDVKSQVFNFSRFRRKHFRSIFDRFIQPSQDFSLEQRPGGPGFGRGGNDLIEAVQSLNFIYIALTLSRYLST